MIRFVNMRTLKNGASKVVRQAKHGDVIVTVRGRPTAVLHAVTEEDLEDYLLAHSPKFLKSLEASYQEYRRKGGASLDALIAQTERDLARLPR